MINVFFKILNMSLTASYCILFICAARLLLKRAPRIFSYLLWIAVAFRLICPVSFESDFSLVGSDFVPDIEYEMAEKTGEIENDFEAYLVTSELANIENVQDKEVAYNNYVNQLNQTYINDTAEIVQDSASTDFSSKQILEKCNVDLQAIFLEVASYIWMIGTCVLAGYGLFTYIRLQQKIKVYAKRISSYNSVDVWQVKGLDTPFVLGFFKAAIYLPEGLSDEDGIQCLAHEYTHIRRKDHLIKQMAFLLVCVYWFNPLVWLAFYLMSKDMEMSCDEVALRSFSLEDRKAYSGTLLELSSTTKYFSGCPLAFGANSTKARIKHIMNYKRPSFWIMVLAVICVVVCVVGLSTNPKIEDTQHTAQSNNTQENANIPIDNGPSVWENIPEEDAAFIRTDSGEIVNVKYIEEFSLLEENSKYHELYQDLEHTLDHITAKMTELNEEKIALTENQLSLQETLKLQNLSEDKVIEFQKQLDELELKLAENEVLLTTLKKEREAVLANKGFLTQQIISAQTSEVLEKFTDYINQPENNAFVTTCYRGEKVNLAMLLYDAGMMLDNAPLTEDELKMLNCENINEQEIMYHFTGKQIDELLKNKMNLPLTSVKYTEEFPNNLKQEWIYLEEFDTYTLLAKGDSKIQQFVCKEISISFDGKLIIAYKAIDANGYIKSGQFEVLPKSIDNQSMEPDDYYFTANEFTDGGYVDDVITNTSLSR